MPLCFFGGSWFWYLKTNWTSIILSSFRSVQVSIYLFVYPTNYLPTCLSIHPSIDLVMNLYTLSKSRWPLWGHTKSKEAWNLGVSEKRLLTGKRSGRWWDGFALIMLSFFGCSCAWMLCISSRCRCILDKSNVCVVQSCDSFGMNMSDEAHGTTFTLIPKLKTVIKGDDITRIHIEYIHALFMRGLSLSLYTP